HGFVVTFRDMDQLKYYIDTDPVHQEFKNFVGDFIDQVCCYDFIDGKFEPRKEKEKVKEA
ncbi:hypothetical protein FRB90_001795, partial [Tulasnella sp. 427]